MVTIKTECQEVSIGYKDSEEVGDVETEFNDYENLESYVLEQVIGYTKMEDVYDLETDTEEIDSVNEIVNEIAKKLISDIRIKGGHWELDGEYYDNDPRPSDGYVRTAFYTTVSVMDTDRGLVEKKKDLTDRKKELESELKDVNSQLKEMV